jgi:acyl carrier protein
MDDQIVKIKGFIVEEFMPDISVDELESDFDLLTGGVVDSLALLQFIAWMEEEFDITIDESELEPDSLRTVQFVDTARAGG